jgi:hypothetical protein
MVALAIAGVGIYVYERYYRGPSDSVLVGTWQLEDGCIDCTHWLTLRPDHKVVGFSDSVGRLWLDHGGRWYAGGELLVIHYESAEQSQSTVLRILDITPDVIRVRWGGREIRMTRSDAIPPNASNQAVQRTAGRSAFQLFVASNLSEQPRTLSPAVADLGSR